MLTADQMIRLNGFPFLDKEEYSFGVPGEYNVECVRTNLTVILTSPSLIVATVMRKELVVITSSGQRLDEIGLYCNVEFARKKRIRE